MKASVRETASLLATLGAGDRFWFWFSPDLPIEAPRLVVTSLQADPGMEALTQASRIRLPSGGRMSMGLAGLDMEGRASLGAPGLDEAALVALAAWVQHHAEEHPALGRLKDARLLAIRPDGVIGGSWAHTALWAGVVAPPVPGTLAGEAEILESLPPGEGAWFWMSGAGPRLVVMPVALDPQGERFRERVRLPQRLAGGAPSLAGVLRTSRARLVLTTQDSLDGAEDIVAALLATGRCARLSGGQLLRMSGERFVEARTLPVAAGPDLSREARLLEGMVEGVPLAFWFSLEGLGGEPLLVLEADRDALKAAAQATGVRGTTTRGQVGLTSKGWVEFRAQSDMPEFVPALARFVAHHRATIPALDRLIGARMTVRDRLGEVTARYRDDDAWQPLR